MKDFKLEKKNFSDLIKAFCSLKLPFFQRVYVWGENNWSELLRRVNWLIKENKEEVREIHPMGFLVLQEVFHDENENYYDVIDGQQRIVTFFLLLSVVSKKMLEKEKIDSKEDTAIQHIRELLIDSKGNLRIELNDKDEQKNFDFIIRSNLKLKVGQPESFKTQIDNADKWFKKKIDNKASPYLIYKQAIENIYFPFMVVPNNTKPLELFLAINKTGTTLGSSDLIKTSFINKFKIYEKQIEISKKWDSDVVKKICNNDNTKINSLLPKFILDLWKIEYGKLGKLESYKKERSFIAKSSNLYDLFEYKFEKSSEDEIEQFVQTSINYAFFYEKIKNYKDDSNLEWWSNNWPWSMIINIHNVNDLSLIRLFPIILSILHNFDKSEKKDLIAEKVKKLINFFLRNLILKQTNDINEDVIFSFLRVIKEGEDTFLNYCEDVLGKGISKEDSEEIDRKTSSELLKKSHLSAFFILNLALKELEDENDSRRKYIEDNYVFYEPKYIISKNPRINIEDYQDFDLSNIGNLTLFNKKNKKSFSNENWLEKKILIKNAKNDCLLNVLKDDKDFINKSNISSSDIKERADRIIEKIKGLGIFR